MIQEKMSLRSRRELLDCIREKYNQAHWKEKIKILDGFVAATGYERKYAIHLLTGTKKKIPVLNDKKNKLHSDTYSEPVRQALLMIWYASNQICSKRLVPFLPELVASLERNGHLSLPLDVKQKILKISAATVDRLLKSEREIINHGMSTTRPGSLIKKQIQVRTFADWNNANPGFVEADLVAHCGGRVDGAFLNTLVLTDIASAWTEFLPLLRKSEEDVVGALKVAQKLLPFSLLGLDTDNGSEFINYKLLQFCEEQKITFTRSRAYHSNDQAHVEEKNGSIVRRIMGYDRYEGNEAWNALAALYAKLRLYVNFFQPSMKLLSKQRCGTKIRKLYDKAQTPYQRLSLSPHINEEIKENLKKQYEALDPLSLLQELKDLQGQFFQYAWKGPVSKTAHVIVAQKTGNIDLRMDEIVPTVAAQKIEPINSKSENIAPIVVAHKTNGIDSEPSKISSVIVSQKVNNIILKTCIDNESNLSDSYKQQKAAPEKPFLHHYNQTNKPKKPSGPRTWRTRRDPFEAVEGRLKLLVELNPSHTAKSLLIMLIQEGPNQFKLKQLRTLQRRVKDWRKIEMCDDTGKIPDKRNCHFLSLALDAKK